LYVTGASCGIGTGHDYATVAYDATNGTELWVARYAGPHPGDCPLDLGDRPSSLAVSSAGTTIAVTGQSPNEDAFQDVTTIAYDADGTQRWVQRYEATGSNPFAGGTSVAVGPDGGVFVLGTISSNEGDLINIFYDGLD